MLYNFAKRVFDIFASLIGLIILFPLFFIVALIIVTSSKGGVFFKQIRVGKNGKLFKILKFRTMRVNSEKQGLQITLKSDNRITKMGVLLRKSKIDELPQLINVLVGAMSIVGPRPEVPYYVDMYTEEQKKVLKVKPGITDLASIEYSNENNLLSANDNPEEKYINEIMPAKLNLNLIYIDKRSFFYDIRLIFKTLGKIVGGS